MSEELKRGIPKGRITGRRELTDEEREKADHDFEIILKKIGVLKEGQSIKDLKKKE